MNEKLTKLGIFGIFTMIASIFLISVNYAEAKVDQNMCKQMYERYVDLGEQEFREKFGTRSFLNDCIKLYKDPSWYFPGKNKIDSNHANLQLHMKYSAEKKASVKILAYTYIGTDKFLVKFRACADQSSLQHPTFLIKSKIDQYITATSKVLQIGKCNDYSAPIKSKQRTDINIEYVTDLSKYSNIRSGPLRI